MSVGGTVKQINASTGGVPKLPVPQADVTSLGLVGDVQRNRKYHGGPKKALLMIASEVIDELRGEDWPVFYGALGENITTAGVDHKSWRTGLRYRIGSVLVELTTPRQPCATLNPYGPGIQSRIYDRRVKALDPQSAHWGQSGFYVMVLEPGRIANNDIIVLEEVPLGG